MEAVFEEFKSLLAEATEQAEAAVKAASPPPPTPTTRVSEYDGGWSETTDPSPDRDEDVDDLEPAAKRPRVTSSSLVGPSGVQTVFSDVGRRYKQGMAASSSRMLRRPEYVVNRFVPIYRWTVGALKMCWMRVET